jgi:hypothetical protein
VLNDLFEDWLINKLNGYFLLLYSSGHTNIAWIAEHINDLIIYSLVKTRLIPPRNRLI